MSDQAMNLRDSSSESEIELLARETKMPVETVHKVYAFEFAKLEQVARIKTFVPVLIRRRVKDLLTQRVPSPVN
jgi:Protein of unknown function (DUF3562)